MYATFTIRERSKEPFVAKLATVYVEAPPSIFIMKNINQYFLNRQDEMS